MSGSDGNKRGPMPWAKMCNKLVGDTREKFRNLMAQKRNNGEASSSTTTTPNNMQMVRSFSTGDLLNSEQHGQITGENGQTVKSTGQTAGPALQGENGATTTSSEYSANNEAEGATGNGSTHPNPQGEGTSANTQEGANPSSSFIIQDDNEMFCLSLVPVMRSFSPKKNLAVRIKILTLIAAEEGREGEDMV